MTNLKIRQVCCTRLISIMSMISPWIVWHKVSSYKKLKLDTCTWISTWLHADFVTNRCIENNRSKNFVIDMIKFDILVLFLYYKGKIEKKWFHVFCVMKIMFDFWASIQVVFQNIVFSYQFCISVKSWPPIANKLSYYFQLVFLICVDLRCPPK